MKINRLTLSPVNICNCCCSYCYARGTLKSGTKQDLLPMHYVDAIMNKFSAEYVDFMGNGETLLLPNFNELVERSLTDPHVKEAQLFTNGLVLTDDLIESIIKSVKTVYSGLFRFKLSCHQSAKNENRLFEIVESLYARRDPLIVADITIVLSDDNLDWMEKVVKEKKSSLVEKHLGIILDSKLYGKKQNVFNKVSDVIKAHYVPVGRYGNRFEFCEMNKHGVTLLKNQDDTYSLLGLRSDGEIRSMKINETNRDFVITQTSEFLED